jgi:hypothetical protein
MNSRGHRVLTEWAVTLALVWGAVLVELGQADRLGFERHAGNAWAGSSTGSPRITPLPCGLSFHQTLHPEPFSLLQDAVSSNFAQGSET